MTSDSPLLSPSEAQLRRSLNGHRAYRRMPRVPPFYPVPTRTRQFTLSACLAGSRRGWTIERQQERLSPPRSARRRELRDGVFLEECHPVASGRKAAEILGFRG